MSEPRTALERMQESRERTNNAYGRARNAAEREVVDLVRDKHPAIYESMKTIIEREAADKDRAVRQARTRSAVTAWFRDQHRSEWNVMLDRHIAVQVRECASEGIEVTIRRRVAS